MSWTKPTDFERELLENTRERSEELIHLAQLVSLAPRVEPLLLRNMRRLFHPEIEPEVESLLWFSPLINARSTQNFSLYQGIARILTDELKTNQSLFNNVWKETQKHTQHWNELDILEQELRFFTLTNKPNKVKRGLRNVLKRISNSQTEDNQLSLARWIKKTLPAILDNEQAYEELHLLSQYSAIALGSTANWTNFKQVQELPEWLNKSLPEPFESSEIGIRLRYDSGKQLLVLEFTSTDKAELALTIPSSLPAKLYIQTGQDNNDGFWEIVNIDSNIELPQVSDSIILRTIDGKAYNLKANLKETESTRTDNEKKQESIIHLAYVKEDQQQAKKIADWFRKNNILIKLFVEKPGKTSLESNKNSKKKLIRLWSPSAKKHWDSITGKKQDLKNTLLLRTKDTPAPLGESESDQLINWEELTNSIYKNKLLNSIKVWAEGDSSSSKFFQRVFISHRKAEPDNKLAKILSNYLLKEGISVTSFNNEKRVTWESEYIEKIEECDIVIWIFSKQYSKGTIAIPILQHAREAKKMIIPILLDHNQDFPNNVKWLNADEKLEWNSSQDTERLQRQLIELISIQAEQKTITHNPDLEYEIIHVSDEMGDCKNSQKRRDIIKQGCYEIEVKAPVFTKINKQRNITNLVNSNIAKYISTLTLFNGNSEFGKANSIQEIPQDFIDLWSMRGGHQEQGIKEFSESEIILNTHSILTIRTKCFGHIHGKSFKRIHYHSINLLDGTPYFLKDLLVEDFDNLLESPSLAKVKNKVIRDPVSPFPLSELDGKVISEKFGILQNGLIFDSNTEDVVYYEQIASLIPKTSPLYDLLNPIVENIGASSEEVTSIKSEIESATVGMPINNNSRYYIERDIERKIIKHIQQGDQSLIIKSPRRTGKTTLLQRIKHLEKLNNQKVCYIDLSLVDNNNYETFSNFITSSINEDLDDNFGTRPFQQLDNFINNMNIKSESFLLLLDEADALFQYDYHEQFFSLVRSWTISTNTFSVILSVESTEAINATLVNSYNIFTLDNFNQNEISKINAQYNRLLKNKEIAELHKITGGQPYLTQLAFQVIKNNSFDKLKEGYFLNNTSIVQHMEHFIFTLQNNKELIPALNQIIEEKQCKDKKSLQILEDIGLVSQTERNSLEISNQIYQTYLLNSGLLKINKSNDDSEQDLPLKENKKPKSQNKKPQLTLWKQCLRILEKELPKQEVNTWLRTLHGTQQDSTLILLAPNTFVYQYVNDNHIDRIRAKLKKLPNGEDVQVILQIGGEDEVNDQLLNTGSVNLYFAYSHKDEALRDELEVHLSMLKRQGIIKTWHDKRIGAGKSFEHELSSHLESSNIILLLVSPYFLASDYCYDIEMTKALSMNEEGKAVVIPIILRPCDWQSTPLAKLMASPLSGKPISSFANQHEAFLDVSNTIKKAALSISNPFLLETNSLDKKLTFNSFSEGKSNQLAVASSKQVAENPGISYNPLFIYGGVGLGKTHLLHAIGNKIFEENNKAKIVCLHSERFVKILITALRTNRIGEFKDYFRSVDALLIEDIQFFAGKNRSMEEFLKVFNILLDKKKQIVVTSDRYPRDIEAINDNLRSGLGRGLTVEIEPPELETRVAIISKIIEQSDLRISMDAAFYIAKKIRTNTAEIEKIVKQIINELRSQKTNQISLSFVRMFFRNIKEGISIQNDTNYPHTFLKNRSDIKILGFFSSFDFSHSFNMTKLSKELQLPTSTVHNSLIRLHGKGLIKYDDKILKGDLLTSKGVTVNYCLTCLGCHMYLDFLANSKEPSQR